VAQNAEDLTRTSAGIFDLNKLQDEMNSYREEILKYVDEMTTKVVSLQKEINAWQENHSMYIRQLREKDNNFEMLKQLSLKKVEGEEMAMTNENERLVADISDLQKKLEIYHVENNFSETILETLDEKKELESQLSNLELSVSHKRLLDAGK